MKFTLTDRSVRFFILFQILAAIILSLFSMIAAYSWFVVGHDHLFGFVHQFYCDMEGNVPNWYSSQLIFFNGVLLGLIGWNVKKKSQQFAWYWFFLSATFFFLSMDEIASTHNFFTLPFQYLFDTHGFLFQAWVIPYAVFAFVIGIASIKFLRSLPLRLSIIFIIAGALYVFAALGMEIIEGPYEEANNIQTMFFASLVTGEELMEMLAMTLFSYGLLDHLCRNVNTVSFFHDADVK